MNHVMNDVTSDGTRGLMPGRRPQASAASRAAGATGPRRPVAAIFALAPVLVSCEAVTPPTTINENYWEIIQQRHDHYRLKEGDKVTITLYNPDHADLNQAEMTVLPDGRTDIFFMSNYKLAGKTLAEVETDLHAAQTQVRDAEVSIQVIPREEIVYLVGEFQRPGEVPLKVKMTLQEAISAVEGVRVTGDTDWALLRRPYTDPRHPDSYRIDLNDMSEDIFLLPGDQVVLGRTALATVVVYMREYFFTLLGTPSRYARAAVATAF